MFRFWIEISEFQLSLLCVTYGTNQVASPSAIRLCSSKAPSQSTANVPASGTSEKISADPLCDPGTGPDAEKPAGVPRNRRPSRGPNVPVNATATAPTALMY